MNAWSISREKGSRPENMENIPNTTMVLCASPNTAPAPYCHFVNRIMIYRKMTSNANIIDQIAARVTSSATAGPTFCDIWR